MREFFRGWKRKIGCMTLVMACVFMGAWIRGHGTKDIIATGNGRGLAYHEFNSSYQGIMWYSHTSDLGYQWDAGWYRVRIFDRESFNPLAQFADEMAIDRRWQWLGFDCGQVHDPDSPSFKTSWFLIPYWSTTIPLTLISAFLLLSKPRKSTLKKLTEPIPAEET